MAFDPGRTVRPCDGAFNRLLGLFRYDDWECKDVSAAADPLEWAAHPDTAGGSQQNFYWVTNGTFDHCLLATTQKSPTFDFLRTAFGGLKHTMSVLRLLSFAFTLT
jgi:hypothetical protein